MCKYYITKDSKGKFRMVELSFEWNENKHGYIIFRKTGCVGGKQTTQPELLIDKGKSGRTVTQQKDLKMASLQKEYLDKGYKLVDKHPNEYTEEELQEIYGDVKMREGSTVKPMLAKQEKDIKNRKIFDKEWYISRKINGVRALIYYDGKDVRTSSRGATNYDLAIHHIIEHPLLVKFFKSHPDVILDGEVYKHHLSLNFISGICRTQKTADDGKDLEFYWCDIVDLNSPFKERYNTIQEYAKELELTEFNPERNLSESELHIQLVPHDKISGFDNMKKLHDEWVSDGWEGAVIRQADSVYKPGSRGNDWVKIKSYFDDTFKVIDYQLGLRGSEDMVFICEMKDGRKFKAMPLGNRVTKEEYIENFENKYKNQLGDCKYFEMSPYGIPQQPKFIAFRWDLN